MMDLQVHYPHSFPLYGIERDAFEARLRDALHYMFDGRRVQQLAEQIDARWPLEQSDVLPLRRIGDEHAFEQCMTLDRWRFDDMSAALRRTVLNAVGARIGVELAEPGMVTGTDVSNDDATNRLAPPPPPTPQRCRTTGRDLAIQLTRGVGIAVDLAVGVVGWKITQRPASAPMVASVVSMSPAQTLRELASSVPDDQRPYRVSVQVEPQAAGGDQH